MMAHRHRRFLMAIAPPLTVSAALGIASAASADLPLQQQVCSIGSAVSDCPQLRPTQGKLISIDITYSATSQFVLDVVGPNHTQTGYNLFVWQELDTKGGDIGSFYIHQTGTVDVAPSDIPSPDPPQITVSGSYSGTETDPVKLARFVGTSSVPILPIAQWAHDAAHPAKVGTGTIKDFYRLSSNVSGTITLNYQPLLIRPPVITLPKQKLPKLPVTVPPYPKPKK